MKRLFEMLRRSALSAESDGVLLVRFRGSRDETAFAELVRRHGPLVWGVCRRGLSNAVDAEDAFQAVFLVLIRRAERLDGDVPLGAWLCRTAVWTVQNLRRRNARQRTNRCDADGIVVEPAAHFELYELLAALPDKYRTPIVLCHLQGWSRRDAAAELGLPEGSLSAVLHRGLALLRKRYGTDPAGPLAVLAVAAVPPALSASAVTTATAFSLAAGVSPIVWTLSQGVLRMFWIKKAVAAIVLAGGLTAGVAGWTLVPGEGGRVVAQTPEAKPLPFKPPEPMPTKTTPKPTLLDNIAAAEAKLEADKKMLAELRTLLAAELLRAGETTERVPSVLDFNAPVIKVDHIEMFFADYQGKWLNYGYSEHVNGKIVLGVALPDPTHLMVLLKRGEADRKQALPVHVFVQIGGGVQGEKDKAAVVRMVDAIVAAGITKIRYSGLMPVEVNYEVRGKERNYPRDEGGIGMAMSTEPWKLTSDRWAKVDFKEIDLNDVFPAKYRELFTKSAAERQLGLAVNPLQLDRVISSVADNHFVWLSVGSKAGFKVGDKVVIYRLLGDKGERAMPVGSIKLTIVEDDKAFGEDVDKPKDGFAPRFVMTDCVLMPNRNPPVKR